MMQNKPKKLPSLVLNIEIRPGLTDSIEVKLKDRLSVQVKSFCEKHRLARKQKQVIFDHLRTHVLKMIEEFGRKIKKNAGEIQEPRDEDDGHKPKEELDPLQTQTPEKSRRSFRRAESSGGKDKETGKFIGFAHRAYRNELAREKSQKEKPNRS